MVGAHELDVVVFGTGYSANRVAERAGQVLHNPSLANEWERDLKLGLSGRSQIKINEVRRSLERGAGRTFPESECPSIKADVKNYSSLVVMAKRCRCVINCVGPYMEFGEAVIRACIETKTNVVDLSGETEWILEMTRKYDSAAREAGVLVISAVGWDSVPSDGLAWLLRSQLTEQERCSDSIHVTLQTLMYMGQRKSFFGSFGGMGAGTLKTVLLGWHTSKGIDFLADPKPVDASKRLLSQPADAAVEYFDEFDLYGVRSELFSDSFVVRASNKRLAEQEQARRRKKSSPGCLFEYNHYFAAPLSLIAYTVALILWVMPKLLRFKPVFRFFMLFFQSGNGPSVSGRNNARASLHGVLKVHNAKNQTLLRTIRAVADVDHDPNDVTAMVLLRSACLLACAQDKLPIRAGCITTAAAFQEKILDVLKPATIPRILKN